ncbi:hypothetical protein CANINC_001984 [Pichia inconspicua]|uniref:VHS domain-containing protein n=1 Tax=Pichia inconspicua TaxID=52247 RepID=A0A4T0X2A3_9ASCO|nr:hypothetical protein CANINC_001984 [[Candida] inconspicua]
MGLFSKHQYTDVTSIIDDCCKSHEVYDEGDDYMESKIDDLLDAIKRQTDFVEPGPVEAARALRKKLKYGTIDEQYNGLLLLDMIVAASCDIEFMKPFFNDDKIIDRLIFFFTAGEGQPQFTYDSGRIDPSVSKPKRKIVDLSLRLGELWYRDYQDCPNMDRILEAYRKAIEEKERKESRKSKRRQQVPDFMNDDADMEYEFELYDEPNRPKTNAELDKKYKIPKINYEKEGPKILQLIAQANILSTNLLNTLNSLTKDELSIHSIKANEGFDECRSIRRKVLRYLQLVQREELLGPLLKCNDDLVVALKKYEERSVPYGIFAKESESDDDSLANYESDHEPVDNKVYTRQRGNNETASSSSNLNKKVPPPVPPKSSILSSEESRGAQKLSIATRDKALLDEFDPFSDVNEVAPARWS